MTGRAWSRLVGGTLAALCLTGTATAQAEDPMLLYDANGTTVRATLQFGANLVAEDNLFWNLSDFAAPGSGYDPDARWLEV